MYTNPFERKHSILRQALDKVMRGDMRLSFRKKDDMSKRSNVSGSTSSVASSTMEFRPKYNSKR